MRRLARAFAVRLYKYPFLMCWLILCFQRVDTDDMGEVLLAELTLDPEVKATMAAYDDIKERTNRSEQCSAV